MRTVCGRAYISVSDAKDVRAGDLANMAWSFGVLHWHCELAPGHAGDCGRATVERAEPPQAQPGGTPPCRSLVGGPRWPCETAGCEELCILGLGHWKDVGYGEPGYDCACAKHAEPASAAPLTTVAPETPLSDESRRMLDQGIAEARAGKIEPAPASLFAAEPDPAKPAEELKHPAWWGPAEPSQVERDAWKSRHGDEHPGFPCGRSGPLCPGCREWTMYQLHDDGGRSTARFACFKCKTETTEPAAPAPSSGAREVFDAERFYKAQVLAWPSGWTIEERNIEIVRLAFEAGRARGQPPIRR